ncbi:unnamed protein product [Ranitomeya imitator]|uniref:Uncharacterized protein n=1 Tax=Ranitomeya imitator TaxID=111125 RepID=A0ABN9LJG1_9NEOB|nr:unnamed protein product [Ranitomeya imitator]
MLIFDNSKFIVMNWPFIKESESESEPDKIQESESQLWLTDSTALVLYKTAWSESVGRDCAAYCAKKYSDHLHKFHENGENGAMWQE